MRCGPTHIATSHIIKRFLTFDRTVLDEQVPRRWHILNEFLDEIVPPTAGTTDLNLDNVKKLSADIDIALVDDRQDHDKCRKTAFGDPCGDCRIFSANLSIPDLFLRLHERISNNRPFKYTSMLILTSDKIIGPRKGPCMR